MDIHYTSNDWQSCKCIPVIIDIINGVTRVIIVNGLIEPDRSTDMRLCSKELPKMKKKKNALNRYYCLNISRFIDVSRSKVNMKVSNTSRHLLNLINCSWYGSKPRTLDS